MGKRGRWEVGRIGRVNNSKVELRWVVVVVVVVGGTMIFMTDLTSSDLSIFSIAVPRSPYLKTLSLQAPPHFKEESP